MKITDRKLRYLIREALSSSDPQALYDRMKEIGWQYSVHFGLLRRLGEELHAEVIDILTKMSEADSSYDGYAEFLKVVRASPYKLNPGGAYSLFMGDPGKDPGPQTPENMGVTMDELLALFDEYEDLDGQFESKNATDQTDRVFGRKRTNIVHKPTGTVINSSTDRKGSLGGT